MIKTYTFFLNTKVKFNFFKYLNIHVYSSKVLREMLVNYMNITFSCTISVNWIYWYYKHTFVYILGCNGNSTCLSNGNLVIESLGYRKVGSIFHIQVFTYEWIKYCALNIAWLFRRILKAWIFRFRTTYHWIGYV